MLAELAVELVRRAAEWALGVVEVWAQPGADIHHSSQAVALLVVELAALAEQAAPAPLGREPPMSPRAT